MPDDSPNEAVESTIPNPGPEEGGEASK